MSSEPVISVNNVGKAYKIWNDPASRLQSAPLLETTAGVFPRRGSPATGCAEKPPVVVANSGRSMDISFEVRQE